MKNQEKRLRKKFIKSFGTLKDESFNFELIKKYFQKKDKKGAFQVLSDKTCNDIDFDELFMYIDRTISKIGQQFLYNTLRLIPSNSEKFLEQEKLIEMISNDINLRIDLQLHLNKLVKDDTYYITSLFQDEHLEQPKWFFIIRLLSFTSFMSILMISFIPQSIFVLLGVFIINMGIHYWNKRNLNQYFGAIPQLLKLNEVAKELIKYDIFNDISQNLPKSIQIIDKVRNRMSFFKLEAKLESEFEMAFWFMLELFKTLFLLEPLLLFGVLKELDTKRKEIDEVYSFVGYIDSLISIASLRKGLQVFCLPEISVKNKTLEANEMYHPLIINCISNTFRLTNKSVLLTGSNMSGKTSFIRTVGLNVLTGLTINTCFAKYFSMTRFRIYSAIRISDDLINDKSYYLEEVLTIKEMIIESQKNESNLFLLDEIFKGTNTIERISAGNAVLSYLIIGNNITFVSTHDIELADLLKDSYELYHFSENVNQKTISFDFKLKTGKLRQRNAIKILEINDYPEEIIRMAVQLSDKLDSISIYNDLYGTL